ncbi:MAG: FAD-dependent oxidoreductase [Acidimicrobiia bacterium]|jgi:2,4-dienoyl-CoA reductase (NADPH2)
MSTQSYPHLFTPGRIGTLELRNRIVMCPMGMLLGNDDGTVSENEAAFYEARARGGAGLCIIGTACVAYPEGTNHPRMPGVSDDRFLPGMRDLAARVHRHGGRVAAQLNYMGTYSFCDVTAGRPRLVPYGLPAPDPDRVSMMVTPEEMGMQAAPFMTPGANLAYKVADEDDIARVIGLYASAADRCRRAGYDGVELHAGHGYLIDEFLSPRNTRDDRWGGSLENRARFLLEVVGAVRERVGRDYPVWVRINAFERHHDIGEQFDEQLRVIEMAVAAGIDAVHLTAYANTDVATAATDSYAPHVVGQLPDHAAKVRARVSVPVITFGRLEPDEAEETLAAGKADFVAMGRKLLADPDLPRKLERGRVDDVRPCIYAYRCIGNIAIRVPTSCVVNAQTGREHDLRLEPTASPHNVLVVGGGPAGMEAARLLASRGHTVTLREASERLGGLLVTAGLVDPLLDRWLGWLIRQIEQSDVAIEVGTRVEADAITAEFDDIVVATGPVWSPPTLPGADRALHVTALGAWLRDDDDSVGEHVVIVGEGKPAVSLAGLCEQRGRRVAVVGPTGVFAPELGMPGRFELVADLLRRGVHLLGPATVEHVGDRSVTIAAGSGTEDLGADTVVLTTGAAPDTRLADALGATGRPVHAIGDCREVGFVEGATSSALALARSLG